MAITVLGATGAGVTPRSRTRRQYGPSIPWLFMGPALVLFVAVLLVPILYTAWLSLQGTRVAGGLIGVSESVFVGLDNYRETLSDPELYAGLLRMTVYGLIVVPVMMGLALLFALLLDSANARARRFSRVAIFLPYAVPGVIASLLWGFMYLQTTSPFVDAATALGLPSPSFFGVQSVFFSVANIAIWGGVGFNMVVLFTGLQAIPKEVYEAARLDGCGELATALRIKIPLLAPSLVMTVVFSLIATLQVFNEPTTLQPLTTAISPTWMPLMKVYTQAFVTNDPSEAAATSLVIAAATLVLSFGTLRLAQRRAFGED